VIDRHGGRLQLDEANRNGTTVTLVLPHSAPK